MVWTKGFGTLGAVKKASAWPTPVVLGAGDGFEYTAESIASRAEFIADKQLNGTSTTLFGDKGNESHNGQIMMDAKYQGLEVPLAMVMGTAGAPVLQGSGVYKHVIKLANDREGKFATLGFDKQVEIWEYANAKFHGFEFSSAPNNERAKLAFDVIAHKLNRNTGAGTNTQATFASVTIPSVREFLLFSQLEILCNDQSGGALGSSDEIYVGEFTMKVAGNMEGDYTTEYGDKVDEPLQNEFTEVTGGIKFPKYGTANSAFYGESLTKTRKKMIATFTGNIAGGSYNYKMIFYFPDVQWSDGSTNVGGPGKAPLDLTFKANRVLAIPTGFPTGYTDALTLELFNMRSTDPLA